MPEHVPSTIDGSAATDLLLARAVATQLAEAGHATQAAAIRRALRHVPMLAIEPPAQVARWSENEPPTALCVGMDVHGEVFLATSADPRGYLRFGRPGEPGPSPRTRQALIALMVAMELDNAAEPTHAATPPRRALNGSP